LINIHTIRFSKDYFSDYESCLKWLSDNDYDSKQFTDLENFYVFDQLNKDRFDGAPTQKFTLDGGVEAVIGMAKKEADTTSDNIQDEASPVISGEDKEKELTELQKTYVNTVKSYKLVLESFIQFIKPSEKLKDGILEDFKKFFDESLLEVEEVTKTIKKNIKDILQPNHKKDEMEVFVPFIMAKEERIVFGEVLVPNEVDGQGHVYNSKEVEKAAHYWMKNWQDLGEMHVDFVEGAKVLESYVAPVSFNIEDAEGNERTIKKGTWLLKTYIDSEDLWKKVKEGEYIGYSMGGVAKVENLD